MCVGNLFKPPKPPAPPPRMRPAPPLKSAAPPPDMVKPEDIREETEEDKLSTRKKKALEIEKVQRGTKEFGAIDPSAVPDTPPGGVAPPV